MTTGKRTILAQGDLDGACFLYSLANAAQCLTGKSVTKTGWSKVLGAVGDTRDFLDGRVGTEHTDLDPPLQESIAQRCVDILSPKTSISAKTIHGLDGESVGRYLKSRSVVVMSNSKHWFCLVEVYQAKAYAACSARWQEFLGSSMKPSSPMYQEQLTPRLRRTFNDEFAASELEFFGGRAIQLTLKPVSDES